VAIAVVASFAVSGEVGWTSRAILLFQLSDPRLS
jgi:hypothetical protein